MVHDSLQVDVARGQIAAHGCGFCAHLRDASDQGDDWRVLFEDDVFVAVPSLGALIPGWLLVVPRDHAVNLSALGPDGVERMWAFVASFRERWENEFGAVVAFEHGPARAGRPAGCGVDHAHLHLVPCGEIDLADAARRMLPMVWSDVGDLSELASATDECSDYLYMKTASEQLACTAPLVPSQALRKVIATEIGVPAAFNWREFPNLDIVRATIARASRD